MAYVKEPFKNLDVMNNFMFNKLTTDPDISEKFCRVMLKSLIGKEVGEITIKAEGIVLPDNPTRRGIRLDVKINEYLGKAMTNVYDIEPHRNSESEYPKKNRHVQALIDKDSMKSGDNDFSHMPDLYIMCITNYDPFGYDYMMYTVTNRCEEVPELEYNDGVKIIYFNTVGTKGGSEELKVFLNYLENSTRENAVDSATQEVESYVESIKDRGQIEGNYMTVGEWIDGIVRDATAEKDVIISQKDTEITQKNTIISQKDTEITQKNTIISQKDTEITQKNTIISQKDTIISEKDEAYNKLKEEFEKFKKTHYRDNA